MQTNQRGSALITALFIMTLVAIAATAMSTRLQLDIYRTRTSINSNKLYLASQAVTGWAFAQLSAPNVTRKSSNFPNQLQHIYPAVITKGRLYDLQAKFNINNVQDKNFQLFFYNLLEKASDNLTASQRTLIFDATNHWISAYQPDRGHDKFLDFYLKQKPPYYPGYQPMQHISEFRLVQGVTATLYQALLPNLTALPDVTAININTASKTVLQALGNGLNESQVHELLEARGEKGITDLSKIVPLLQTLDIPLAQITIESTYFLSIATTSIDDSQLTVYTLIKRTKNRKGQVSVSMVSERLNAA